MYVWRQARISICSLQFYVFIFSSVSSKLQHVLYYCVCRSVPMNVLLMLYFVSSYWVRIILITLSNLLFDMMLYLVYTGNRWLQTVFLEGNGCNKTTWCYVSTTSLLNIWRTFAGLCCQQTDSIMTRNLKYFGHIMPYSDFERRMIESLDREKGVVRGSTIMSRNLVNLMGITYH